MARIIINEEEKFEILNKHKDFKKILENELKSLNKGLVSEQNFPTGEVSDPLLKAAESAGCLKNGKIITFENKPVYVKKASKAFPDKFEVGDTIVQYNDYTYWVFPQNGAKRKGPYRWSCPEINKAAQDKIDSEAKLKSSSVNSLKDAYIKKYTGDPYFYKATLTNDEMTSGNYVKVKIKGTSTAEGGPFGETGLIMYKQTSGDMEPGRASTNNFKRVNVTPPSKEECKKDIADIYNSYTNSYGLDRQGNLDPTQIDNSQQETLNNEINRARACTTYYGNWGILGGGKQLDMYIDVLRGDKPATIAGREKYIKRDSIYNLN
jgi:hypothetical protein